MNSRRRPFRRGAARTECRLWPRRTQPLRAPLWPSCSAHMAAPGESNLRLEPWSISHLEAGKYSLMSHIQFVNYRHFPTVSFCLTLSKCLLCCFSSTGTGLHILTQFCPICFHPPFHTFLNFTLLSITLMIFRLN